MGFFPIYPNLWPSCGCHLMSAVVSLLLAILIGSLPNVFLVDSSNGFEDILYGSHYSDAFSTGTYYFLITTSVLTLFVSLAVGLMFLYGSMNERYRPRAIVFYIEVIFGLLAFICMCICADKSRQLEGPIFFHGLLKGWQKSMDIENACVRAVDKELDTCQESIDHLSSTSKAQTQMIFSAIFWLVNFLSLWGSAVWMCVRGIVQIDSLLYCADSKVVRSDVSSPRSQEVRS